MVKSLPRVTWNTSVTLSIVVCNVLSILNLLGAKRREKSLKRVSFDLRFETFFYSIFN